jgi:hypothetical protein
MRIDISGHANDVPLEVRSYAQLRVCDAVGYREAWIDALCVRLFRVDRGPTGEATRCRLVAHLLTGPPVCSMATGADPYVAIDRAAVGLYDGLEAPDVHRLTTVARRIAPLYAHPRSLPSASKRIVRHGVLQTHARRFIAALQSKQSAATPKG